MQIEEIRRKLHQIIDEGDEKLLNLMNAIVTEYSVEYDVECAHGDEEIDIDEKIMHYWGLLNEEQKEVALNLVKEFCKQNNNIA